jgi:hypothetical protein
METYVFLAISQCATITTMFGLWMSRLNYDTFSLVINFINQSWVPCHIIVGLFEVLNLFGVTFIEQVKVILVKFNLTNKVIVYVKYEGTTLNYFTIAFTFVVS